MSSPASVRRVAALAAAGLAATALLTMQTGPAAAQPGKIRNADVRGAITNSYIVVFKDAVGRDKTRSTTDRLAGKHRATIKFRYGNAVQGFAATMTKRQAQRLSYDPNVAFVEQDRTVEAVATQSPTPSWGLDRIDQRNLPLNTSYTYPNPGAGVTAYVIDSGIRTTHTNFGGRAVWGTNTTGDGKNTDCNGHGTHVAGTVGGTAYGVAKAVRLVAVKVLGCTGSGSLAGVAAGVDWVTRHHTTGPAVANMSLGASGTSSALEQAVRNSIADGVTYSLASGNSNSNACNFTPARTAEAITVNASTTTDARASFSNFGTCTDIFAPGQSITSAWNTGDTATNTMSGTSMAAPHVAGAAALILGATPTATPAKVWSTISANATPNKITNAETGSPNRLLYVGSSTTPPPTGCAPVTNGTDVAIRDNSTVQSAITIASCSGNASSTATVGVHIVHTYRGDLVIDLITPTGAVLNLHNRAGGSADNLDATYVRNLSAYPANGTWRLRVRDVATSDVGRIDSWTLDL